jgi:hypothetical protein
MTPPPTSIDGTDIKSATIDGQDVQEITVDGQTVFSAVSIPNSAVLNITGESYDESANQYVANIGPNVADASGDPSKVTNAINGFAGVKYDGSNDASQTKAFSTTTDPIAIILTASEDTDDDNGIMVDGGSALELAMNDDNGADGYKTFRTFNDAGAQSNQGTSDTNPHVFALIGRNGDDIELQADGSSLVPLNDQGSSQLSGLTVGARGDIVNFNDCTVAEVTVLDSFSGGDLNTEVQRQGDKYGISIA